MWQFLHIIWNIRNKKYSFLETVHIKKKILQINIIYRVYFLFGKLKVYYKEKYGITYLNKSVT